jgi:hypothetical protein
MKPLTNPAIDIYPIDHAEHLSQAGAPNPSAPHTLEGRLQALENRVQDQAQKLDSEFLSRINALEQLLNMQVIATRQDFTREANDRRELFAQLAAKFSRNLERLEQKTVALDEKQRLAEKQLQHSLSEEIDGARQETRNATTELLKLVKSPGLSATDQLADRPG